MGTTATLNPAGPWNVNPTASDARLTSILSSGPQRIVSPAKEARSAASPSTLGAHSNVARLAPSLNRLMSSPPRMEFMRWCRNTPGVSYMAPLPSNALSGMIPSVVPGIADAVGSLFPGTPKLPCSRMALSAARMKVDFPTLALPSTYTSRPRRSANIAPTASRIPVPRRDDTHTTRARVSFRSRTTSFVTQSRSASRSVPAGNRSTFVNTNTIGLAPTTSRTRLRKQPWKSVASTIFTTNAFFVRTTASWSRSSLGAMRPASIRAPPWPATALTMSPWERSEHRAQSIAPSSCRCLRFVSYASSGTKPETEGWSVCKRTPQP